MSVNAVQQMSLVPSGQPGLAVSAQLSGSEEVVVDDDIPVNSSALVVNVGVAATSKLKGFMIANTGAADITALTLDSGTVNLALKAGESFAYQGAGVAKKIADAWSAATTMLVLKVTTGAGPDLAHLRVIVIADA